MDEHKKEAGRPARLQSRDLKERMMVGQPQVETVEVESRGGLRVCFKAEWAGPAGGLDACWEAEWEGEDCGHQGKRTGKDGLWPEQLGGG